MLNYNLNLLMIIHIGLYSTYSTYYHLYLYNYYVFIKVYQNYLSIILFI